MKNGTIAGLLACLAALGGCSGGSGGAGGQQTEVLVRLSALGTAAPQAISGVEVTLGLPAGVTVAADAASGKVAGGVVAASGVAGGGSAVAEGHHAASALKVVVMKTSGFDAGEFATVRCTAAAGVSPAAADFALTGFKAVDANGAAIAGLSGALSLDAR